MGKKAQKSNLHLWR